MMVHFFERWVCAFDNVNKIFGLQIDLLYQFYTRQQITRERREKRK